MLRRHDGKEEIFPGFEFENYESEGLGPESLQSFVRLCQPPGALTEESSGPNSWNGCDSAVGARVVSTIEAMYRSAADARGGFVPVHQQPLE